ncbi:MAG: GLPGLI family protein [Cryomorphaceae bacterium]|nr:GLPGLI family protein [Cryomorphaceae bacterium]
MKKLWLIALVFSAILPMCAQTQGRIVFEEEWERKFRKWSMTEKYTWELIFNDTMAICRWVKPEIDEGVGAVRTYRWMQDLSDIYVSFPREKRVEDAQDFMRRTFVMQDAFPPFKWKMTGKQGLVESYPCMEAMYVDGQDTIYAWFSPRIPISIGPREFRGLPGMILFIEADGGSRKITIQSVDLEYLPTPEDFVYKLPKGQKMDYAKFLQLRREKADELKEMYGQ